MKKHHIFTVGVSALALITSITAFAVDQSPYGGTPFAVPTRIEGQTYQTRIDAEYFDEGGEGVAYHDTDAGNNGGTVRATDVDIGSDGHSATHPGHFVGWTQAGEWLEYTIDVQEAGYYLVEAQVGSVGEGGTFHIEFDGVDKTGPLQVPDTGDWRIFQKVAKQGVYLSAGVQVMRLALDSIGPSASVGTFDWIGIAPTIVAIPGSVQAEWFNEGDGIGYRDSDSGNNGGGYRATGVDIRAAGAAGLTYVGWTQAGEWLEYSVNVQATDFYQIDIRVASDGRGGAFHIELDGVDKTGRIEVPDTGGWREWRMLSVYDVRLAAGLQTMRVVMDEIGPSGNVGNIDSLGFGRTSAPPSSQPFRGAPATIPGHFEASDFDEGGEGVAYHDTTAGNNGGVYRATNVDLEASGTGAVVAWTQAGEWLNYTVNVQTEGYYTVEVASGAVGVGGTFHLEFNGIDVTGPVVIPDTHSWGRFGSVWKRRLYLQQGTQVMRIVFDTNGVSGAAGNVAGFFFYLDNPATLPGFIWAADFDVGGEGVGYHDVETRNLGEAYRPDEGVDIGADRRFDKANFYVGWTRSGEWLKYHTNVASDGYYSIGFTVASRGAGGPLHLEVDGVDVTGAFAVPDTGDWLNWDTFTLSNFVYLSAGPHVMRLVFDGEGPSGNVGNVMTINVRPQ